MPDREKVIGHLNDCMEASRRDNTWVFVRKDIVADAIDLLKKQEVVSAHWDDDTGHWIEGDRNGIDKHTRTTGEMIDTFRCSWCGFYQYWKTPFCPNCGAKMEGR